MAQRGIATLKIGAARFEGWEDISVTHSIERIASNFNLTLTDRWAAEQKPIKITAGDICTLELDGESLLNGYIDNVNIIISANSRRLNVSGCSRTADLVDCSAITEGGQFKSCSLFKIAQILCEPFGITVINEVPEANDPLTTDWQIEPSETVFEALERAARFVRCLLMPNPKGEVVITRASNQLLPIPLKQGELILDADVQFQMRERFSEYIIKGDHAAGGDFDTLDSEAVTQAAGKAVDIDVTRYRPLLIIGEDNLDNKKAIERADWEMRRRRARSRAVTITVQGWTMPHSGELWPVNRLIRVQAPSLYIDEPLLITTATFSKSANGTLTKLTLMPKEGFDIEPIEQKKNEDQITEAW